MEFRDRAAFRQWLTAYGDKSGGIWLLFGKKGGPATLKPGEALEEALCFGWIDGRMQRIDETRYRKYFARRTAGSHWSEKNKALAAQLEARGIMTEAGRDAIAEAKRSGRWTPAKPPAVTGEHIARLDGLLKGHEPAHTHFKAMPPSIKKTYARAYFDAKTDAGRERRFMWMVDRLNKNLKPM